MTTVAILPVKRFELAKQRLGDALDAEARRALARAMVIDVLDALQRVEGLGHVLVVTATDDVAALAQERGAEVVDDADDAGQSAAALQALARAGQLGATTALLVPGDCPALDPDEVTALLEGGRAGPSVTIVPDRHGTGTNALLLAPPVAIVPAFGPGSFERHVTAARAAGIEPAVANPLTLLLDVDTGDDLDALRARLAENPAGARQTRAVLDSL